MSEKKLTEVELLKLQNIHLQIDLLESQKQRLVMQEGSLAREVGTRLGIDMGLCKVDMTTGVITVEQLPTSAAAALPPPAGGKTVDAQLEPIKQD